MRSIRSVFSATTGYFLCWLFVLAACKKNDTGKNELPLFSGFALTREHNPSLSEDIRFTIDADTIRAAAPDIFHKRLKPKFTTNAAQALVNGQQQESGVSEQDFSDIVSYTLRSAGGLEKIYHVKIQWLQNSLPHIYINTEGGALVDSKDNYINAVLTIDGKGKYPDYTGATQIRGRGNSTWWQPKKPYRLKLASKSEMFGLPEERDWVLLANYLDPTLMLNAVAMKIGHQLNLAYTNTIIPVDLTMNGEYAGSYNFTQQIEQGPDRVNIGSDGLLLELDVNFDEDFQFRSQEYDLPVMIKYPDLGSAQEIEPIAQQFNALASLMAAPDFPGNGYADHLDLESLAGFLIVYLLTDNHEPNHPKSVYMHKRATGKFTMGPIWDFDWAYSYNGVDKHFVTASSQFFRDSGETPGAAFFARFTQDPAFVGLLRQKWTSYRSTSFDELIQFVEQYSVQIKSSKNEDFKTWNTGNGDFMGDVGNLKNWLQQRAAYLDGYIGGIGR